MRRKAVFALPGGNETFGLFAVGTDLQMYFKLFSGLQPAGSSPWLPSQTGWAPLGGQFDSAACAGRHGRDLFQNTGSFDVFGLGLDDEIWTRTVGVELASQPPAAGGWQQLGLPDLPPPLPAIEPYNGPLGVDGWVTGDFYLDNGLVIVGLGTDNHAYLKSLDPAADTWLPSPFTRQPLGGVLLFEPAVAGGSSIDIFGVGTDRQMFHMAVDASKRPLQAADWVPAGLCFNSAPGVVRWAADRVDVFALGIDNKLYHRGMENGAGSTAGRDRWVT